MDLHRTLQSLADLVQEVEEHEILHDLDEDEQIRRIETMRADIAKGNRVADANERLFEGSVEASEQRQQPKRRGDPLHRPRD